ncbi:hypothetical protein Tco_1416709, partial [Tanacetum coccineum]
SGSRLDTAYPCIGYGNIILIPYLEYGVLSISGYGVLGLFLCGLCESSSNSPSESEEIDSAQTEAVLSE